MGVVLTVPAVGGCGKPTALSCADTTTLAPADAQVRVSLAYVDRSTEVGKSCSACQQFVPGPEGECGGCKVLKGSIDSAGFCRSFLAKDPTG